MARGRKPTPKLFLPGMLTEATQPLLLNTGGDNIWRDAIAIYTVTDEGDSFEQVMMGFQRLGLAEMARIRWDRRIKWKKALRNKPQKAVLDCIHRYGEFLDALLSLVSEVWMVYPCNFPHPSVWFFEILEEWEASGHWHEGLNNKGEVLAAIRSANKKLWDRSGNPFSQPATHLLIDRALIMAGDDRTSPETGEVPRFWSDYYRPFVDARRKIATHLATHGQFFSRKDGKLARGKKVKPK